MISEALFVADENTFILLTSGRIGLRPSHFLFFHFSFCPEAKIPAGTEARIAALAFLLCSLWTVLSAARQ